MPGELPGEVQEFGQQELGTTDEGRHSGHDGVAKSRAEKNHQKPGSGPGSDTERAAMFATEEEVGKGCEHANQDD